jgi:hypothetical protein
VFFFACVRILDRRDGFLWFLSPRISFFRERSAAGAREFACLLRTILGVLLQKGMSLKIQIQ